MLPTNPQREDALDYDALSNFDLLDLAWDRFKIPWSKPDNLDDNAARLVRDKIAEKGLKNEFQQALAYVVGAMHLSNHRKAEWLMINATARQQMIAALRAYEGEEER
jgi:hypothetical protein